MSTREGGFTLVELLIGMAVMSLLMGTAASAYVVARDVTGQTTTTLTVSQDLAFTSAQLDKDVQSAKTVSTSVPGCSGTSGLVIALTRAVPAETVDYSYAQVDGRGQLLRTRCDASGNALPEGVQVTARSLAAKPVAASTSTGVTVDLVGTDGTTARLTATRRIR